MRTTVPAPEMQGVTVECEQRRAVRQVIHQERKSARTSREIARMSRRRSSAVGRPQYQ